MLGGLERECIEGPAKTEDARMKIGKRKRDWGEILKRKARLGGGG